MMYHTIGVGATMLLDIMVDLDDTLVPTAWLYSRASWQCGALVQEAISPYPMGALDILKFEHDIDLHHAKHYGFNPRRFQMSWQATYVECCQRAGIKPVRAIQRRLWWTAATFKEGPFESFPGCDRACYDLLAVGHRLHLVTSGDDSLQRRKIRDSMVGRWFNAQHIVPMDKRAVMQEIRDQAKKDGRGCVMVGDSKRSDIGPAIELGIPAVWIPGVQWTFAHQHIEEGFLTVPTFAEVPALLKREAEDQRWRDSFTLGMDR
jgi:putative hydrolase of the HAD superfamily